MPSASFATSFARLKLCSRVRQRPERKLLRAQLQNASERGLDEQQLMKSLRAKVLNSRSTVAAVVHRIMPTLRPATIPASADAPSKHRDQGTKEFHGAGIMARISEAAR
ncbi:hypothetical protein ACO2JO_18665 [Leptospira interrogans]